MAMMGVVLAPSGWRLRGAILVAVGAAIGAAAMTGAAPKPVVSVPWPPPAAPRKVEPAPAPPERLETVAALPVAIHGVTLSPYDYQRIAVWNDRDIFASADEGRTFERVLVGDGIVGDVAFDPEGQLLAFRGDRWLGIRSGDADRPEEEWSPVGGFRPREDHDDALEGTRPRLIVNETHLAVVGVDPVDATRLLIAWRAGAERWHERTLFHDRSERWETADVDWSEAAMPGQFQLVVHTWQPGDCGGWDRYQRVVFDTRRQRARAEILHGYPDVGPRPDPDIIARAALEPGGRWIGLDPADARRLVRTRL
jgi:hypothetical protein